MGAGGAKKTLGKAELFPLSLEQFFGEGRDICRDTKSILGMLPVSELSWVCKDVELGDIPHILIYMRQNAVRRNLNLYSYL